MKRQSTKIEYPLYNVCYHQTDGKVRTVSEKVSLKKGLEAMKRFDRMLCSNSKMIQGIAYMFLLPILDTRVTEDNRTEVTA